MTAPTSPVSRYQIADLTVDLRQRKVLRGGREIPLGRLTFELLATLVERWPDVVTQDEAAQRVWAGRPVSSETVAQRVKMLRQALGDDARNPRYVRLLRGHGYQLLPARHDSPPAHAEPVVTPVGRAGFGRRALWLASIGAFALILAVAVALNARRAPDAVDAAVYEIAVLPFRDLSADGGLAYLGHGLAEELMDQLLRYEGIRVAGRNSSQLLIGDDDDRSIARRLGVEHVLRGTVREAGDGLKISAELLGVADGRTIWSDTYDPGAMDAFTVQKQVAREVADALNVSLVIDPAPRSGGTDNAEAYDHFLRGRYLLMRFEEHEAALAELNEAVRLDPNFGLAYGLLAHAWRDAALHDAGRMTEAVANSRAMGRRSLDVAPGSYMAHAAMGEQYVLEKRWLDADAAFRRAAELQGVGLDDGNVLFLLTTGRVREALPLIEALAKEEPLLVFPQHWLAAAYDMLGDHERALIYYRAGKELPGDHGMLDGSHQMRRLVRGEIADPLSMLRRTPFGRRLSALRSLDDRDAARAAFREAFAASSDWSAADFAGFSSWASFIGDPELAVDSMRRTLALTPWYLPIVWTSVWEPTRAHPAFEAFMRELGLPGYWRQRVWPEHCRPLGAQDFECG